MPGRPEAPRNIGLLSLEVIPEGPFANSKRDKENNNQYEFFVGYGLVVTLATRTAQSSSLSVHWTKTATYTLLLRHA
jgi:hypothetical protein